MPRYTAPEAEAHSSAASAAACTAQSMALPLTAVAVRVRSGRRRLQRLLMGRHLLERGGRAQWIHARDLAWGWKDREGGDLPGYRWVWVSGRRCTCA